MPRSTAFPSPAPGRPAAFFDRDGVINIDHGYVSMPDRFDLVDGAAQALTACRNAGYLVFVVTNQSGIARGYFDEDALDRIHRHMRSILHAEGAEIDDIRYCPHWADAVDPRYRRDCAWRKPAPGMILDLVRQWSVDRSRSFLVGDKASDLDAASRAGISGHLFTSGDLADFVRPILATASLPKNMTAP